MAEQDQKREVILEAALKRFKRFGLAKTTMDEIARDLEISKGSLYYYFSDKDRIYVAVVERIVNDCFTDISTFLQTAGSVQEVMDRYLSVKERILLDYHFLFGINLWVSDKPSSLMRQIGEMVHQSEIRFISSWLKKGIELGEVAEVHDPSHTADLLVQVLFGFWINWCKWQAGDFDLQDANNIKEFMSRERKVLTIFFNGLR
ncbi:TetR/AcrR family transcriptional regulator [Chitinophaga deserti]|uniref:TetR/AcrR family transcriptional regulator n=1 Tax=Chitinophaga deserti TaxID=2164099 RepID=UPI000D6AAA9C|nr:TetR/AcrR family transcriptional regulator [Chitinophaga deserti]